MLIVTAQSFDARKQIESDLKSKKREATVQKKIAHEQGDLRENAGFVEAKRDIALTGRRLAELELDRPDLMIIKTKEWLKIDMMGEPNAQIGAVVTIERSRREDVFEGVENKPTQETYIIGGAWDNDLPESPEGMPSRLPYVSPLARLLIPHDVGFKGTLETSGDVIRLVDARPPTQEELKTLFPEAPEKKKPAPQPDMEM